MTQLRIPGTPMLHPITLPAPALSRRWVASLLWSDGLPYTFPYILHTLAPDVYAALQNHSMIECYKALLNWLDSNDETGNRRLPINILWAQTHIEDYEYLYRERGGTSEDAWWESTIPLLTFGVDIENLTDQESQAKALIICEVTEYGNEYDLKAFPALVPYLDVIPNMDDCDITEFGKPPKGRKFIEPWDGLGNLCDWMASMTGHDILNLSDTDVWEGAIEMPPWTVDDLRSLIDDWKDAQVVMNSANLLADFIDKHPRERLPLLQRVIHQDVKALESVTIPDPLANRTLIQVLA